MVLLTSMDRDGTKKGFDLELKKQVSRAVTVPIIASGGVGNLEHLAEGILREADAVLQPLFFILRIYNWSSKGPHGSSRDRSEVEALYFFW